MRPSIANKTDLSVVRILLDTQLAHSYDVNGTIRMNVEWLR